MAEDADIPAEDKPVITGVPDNTGLVKVLFVSVWTAVATTIVPVVLGIVSVLSCVGSTTVRVVS